MTLCEAHYYRIRRTGELGDEPVRDRQYGERECIVDGCATVIPFGSYCSMHAARIRRNGDPDTYIHQRDRALPRGEDHPRWTGEGASYSAIHQRLRRERGSASDYACSMGCGRQAQQWSITREDAALQPHSPRLDDYRPLCTTCHKRYDIAALMSERFGTSKEPAPHHDGPKGESNARARLTETDVRAIRALVAAGEPYRVPAAIYGISSSTVGLIVRRRTWRHVA